MNLFIFVVWLDDFPLFLVGLRILINGFLDLWIWVFGGWLMVAQLNGYVNFIDGTLIEWDGGWVVVWLDDGGWVVG